MIMMIRKFSLFSSWNKHTNFNHRNVKRDKKEVFWMTENETRWEFCGSFFYFPSYLKQQREKEEGKNNEKETTGWSQVTLENFFCNPRWWLLGKLRGRKQSLLVRISWNFSSSFFLLICSFLLTLNNE